MTKPRKWPLAAIAFALLPFAISQVPPPPPPRPPLEQDVAARIASLKQELKVIKPVNTTAERAVAYGRVYLQSAEKESAAKNWFAADRLIGASGSLLHVAEHQRHLAAGGGPKGPPSSQELKNHLQRVYFRLKQAEFFLSEINDQRASAFPKWARDFYQLAIRAYDRKDLVAADENAKCAEEVVAALERLAQSQLPVPSSPPPPPPAPPAEEPRP